MPTNRQTSRAALSPPTSRASRKLSSSPPAIEEPLRVEIDTAGLQARFRQLSDKGKLLYNILRETHRNRGLGELTAAEAIIKAESAEKDVREVPLWALDYCFVQARNNHNASAPFQLCEVVQEWRRLKGDQAQAANLYAEWMASHSRAALPAASKDACDYCRGLGWCWVRRYRFCGVPCVHRKYLVAESEAWLIERLIEDGAVEKHLCDGDERWALNLQATRGAIEGYRIRLLLYTEVGDTHGVTDCPNKCQRSAM